IRTRDQHLAHGVLRAAPESSLAHFVVARILVEYGWQHSAYHEVFDRAVRELRGVTLPVPFHALPVGRFAVFGLTDAGENRIPGIFGVVECRSCHNLEFLSGREPWNVSGIDGEKVWQRPEEPVI